METLGRLLNGAFLVAVTIGWIAILLPVVVKRLRRYPRPTFPPAPLAQSLGSDGAANAAVIVDAIRPSSRCPFDLVPRSHIRSS